MNNKRSPGEQFILIALLTFSAYLLSQQFFGPQKKGTVGEAKPAPTLAQAFKGLDGQSSTPSKEAALKEVASLQADIEKNSSDAYSYWARLRAGLLQQYILKTPVDARKSYTDLISRNKNEILDAQAIYQKGDLAWRQSKLPAGADGKTLTAEEKAALESEGVTALEQIPFHARGHSEFLDHKIFVPDVESSRGDPLQLPARWEQLPLKELLGIGSTLPANAATTPDPRFILTRVDEHYSTAPSTLLGINFGTAPLYRTFDAVVHWFGAQPAYSYGLALIVFALVTRLLMQPLIKKQYDSMKGMALIAPEMKRIQDKYKGKADQESQMRMMKEIREVQKQHGVNPMGCGLSLVIQMPVFFLIVLPLINHYQAKMELTGAHFLWINSLAHPDIPLLVLYAISMFVSVRLSATPPADAQQAQMQKIMTIMSPMFALVLWSYPSAFILYWFTYNALSTALQWRMMKASDPTKNAIKTLMGTATPAPAAATPAAESAAIPPRPTGGGASKPSLKKENVVESALNGASNNGAAKNGVAKSGAPLEAQGASAGGKSTAGENSAARRRRRRK